MAVEAVAHVVIQKITDMLREECIIGQDLILKQLHEIGKALEEMSGYLIDAENKQKRERDPTIKDWADKYLRNVYAVEDIIETFAFRIARHREGACFLRKPSLLLMNFTACKNLKRKMKKIRTNIKHLNQERPDGVENASVHSIRSLDNDNTADDRRNDSAEEDGHRGKEDHAASADENAISQAHVPGSSRHKVEMRSWSDISVIRDPMQKQYTSAISQAHVPGSSRHKVEMRSWSDISAIRDPMQKQYTSAISQAHVPGSSRHKVEMRSWSDISVIRERCWQTKLMSSYSYEEDELEIVGFKDDLRHLVDELTNEGLGAHRIISVFGEIGSGKTTLTQAVLATKTIKDSFKSCCARVDISKDSAIENILLKLLKQVGNSKDQDDPADVPSLKARLLKRLNDKKYLIVLDGVEASDVWERLRDAFPDGSKIIITTSELTIAKCARKTINVKRLSDEETWELFLRKAAVEEVRQDLKKIILKICDGLPLNVVLLGSLLSAKKEKDFNQWDKILCPHPNWHTSDILALSYNDLPSDLKLCMLYMALFPKEYDIPVRRLLRLWLAEGFVKRPDNNEIFLEDVAQQYFDELFQRSLIQISKQRSDGNHMKKCRLLGVLHDFLSSRALDIKLFHVFGEAPDSSDAPRRLVEYVDTKKSSPDSSEFKCVRSYLSFNFQKKDIPAEQVEGLLKKIIKNGFRLLRVLDLEGVYKPSLPDNLGDLFHLRYLGLRWTSLDALPSSVGELAYLETLDIKHTHVNSFSFPIWKLKHLRHLNLNEMRLDMPVAPPSPLPENLLTLWGLSIFERGCLLNNGLKGLQHLRELGIKFHLKNCEGLVAWISNLTALQQLRLRSVDDNGHPTKLSLNSFSKLDQLSSMNLLGCLPKLPAKVDLPQNIKVLSLSVSQLTDDPMPTLGQLEKLTVLRLLANSYLGEKIECARGGFKELRVLKLWMLQNLKEWDLKEGAMEKLEELNIRCCVRLKSIPRVLLCQRRFKKRRTFKELTLTNMPQSFIEEVEQSKSMDVSVIVKEYKFTPLPWEQGDDSVNKGMHSVATNANGLLLS